MKAVKKYKFKPDYTVPIGRCVKEMLLYRNKSKAQLAAFSNFSIDYLNLLLNDTIKPNSKEVGKMARFCNIPISLWVKINGNDIKWCLKHKRLKSFVSYVSCS